MLTRRYKRYLRQILPFGFTWLFFGLLYVMIEAGLMGNLVVYPATGNRYSLINALFSVSIGSFVIGLVQG
ncbi:MAG: hypothetical protein KJO63_10640, partial [Maribacter sp.]|nr:hypothetical protein [Maribacter sp.]